VIRDVDRQQVEYLLTRVGSMFTLFYFKLLLIIKKDNYYLIEIEKTKKKGELTNWQFDWGGRL
jgi:hypothetical protein